MRRAVRCLACLALIACAPARAQTFDATRIGTPADLSTATWRFTAGDDPRYADPAFDDSQWNAFSPQKNFKSQGYGAPSTIWWSRLHVQLPPGPRDFAILILEDSHQVYVNGCLIGQKGGFPDHPRTSYIVQQLYSIPAQCVPGDSAVIAIRLSWNAEYGQMDIPFTYEPMLLGDQKILSDIVRRHRYSGFFAVEIGDIARGLFAFMIGVWALALFRAQPDHREYLWLALMSLCDAVWACLVVPASTNQVPIWEAWLPQSVTTAIFDVAFVLFVCAFLRVHVNWWVRAYCVALLAGPPITAGCGLGWISFNFFICTSCLLSTPVDVFAPGLAIRQLRRGDREAGILLLPLLLLGAADYVTYLDEFLKMKQGVDYAGIVPNIHLGPARIPLPDISGILFYLTIGGIMLHRSMRITREQQRTASELEEGRSVQTFLLGRDASAPGFTVESAYLPAREVGGDFFQTIAGVDGSLLAVIGDVAGKGLQAAMRVSMLIGAVRLSADETPAALLRRLNRVLLQDGGSGLTTCLVARLDANGTATIANAGHLSPYINGRELAIDGGLPLGVAAGTDYTQQTFPFAAGDVMLLLSDGVVEARSSAGELFGFKRMADTAADVTNAAALAETARAFGQDDDITVLLLQRATAA